MKRYIVSNIAVLLLWLSMPMWAQEASNNAVAQANLCGEMAAKGQNVEAIASCQKALQLKPDLAMARYNLGAALLANGQLNDAVAAFRNAPLNFKLQPDDPESLRKLSDDLVKLDKGLRGAAIVVLRRANHLKRHESLDQRYLYDRVTRQMAFLLIPSQKSIAVQLARQLFLIGQWDEGIATFREYSALVDLKTKDNDDATVLWDIGRAMINADLFDEGVLVLGKAVELKPDRTDWRSGLGNAFCEAKRFDEGIAQYRGVLDLKPDDVDSLNEIGIALDEKARDAKGPASAGMALFEEAVATYRKALELDPKDFRVHNNLGNALWDKGQLDEAIASYQTAIKLKPDYVWAHRNLGNVLKKKGDIAASKREIAEAERLERENKKK